MRRLLVVAFALFLSGCLADSPNGVGQGEKEREPKIGDKAVFGISSFGWAQGVSYSTYKVDHEVDYKVVTELGGCKATAQTFKPGSSFGVGLPCKPKAQVICTFGGNDTFQCAGTTSATVSMKCPMPECALDATLHVGTEPKKFGCSASFASCNKGASDTWTMQIEKASGRRYEGVLPWTFQLIASDRVGPVPVDGAQYNVHGDIEPTLQLVRFLDNEPSSRPTA